MCGRLRGVRVVTEAEAARAARHAVRGIESSIEELRAQAARARRMLAEHSRSHSSWDQVRDLLTVTLNGTKGVSPKARAYIETSFGVTLPAVVVCGPTRNHQVEIGQPRWQKRRNTCH